MDNSRARRSARGDEGQRAAVYEALILGELFAEAVLLMELRQIGGRAGARSSPPRRAAFSPDHKLDHR